MNDAFSKYHPVVNFIFFVGAIGFGVVIQHPAFLVVGVLCASVYYLLLNGKKALKLMLYMLPFVLIVAAINPLFNTQGKNVLFYLCGRPYTGEALMYGVATAAILLVMILWFGCYNAVMTSDKFTFLFGNLIPSVSLLLVMVFRMVPQLVKKTKQIISSRRSIGKGSDASASLKDKLSDGMAVLSSLTSWALEGSIVTADSMRSRGYGCARRKSFLIYRMETRDWVMLGVQMILLSLMIIAVISGHTSTEFIPEISVSPISWGLMVYTAYLCIPIVLRTEEAVKWRILRSKI